jgi:hypothetical protein
MVMSHVGLGTKNDCAGKDHQPFISPDQASEALLMYLKVISLFLDLIYEKICHHIIYFI